MKTNKILFGIALAMMTGAGLVSCSNENHEPSAPEESSMLVKAPEVIAYSGDHVWNQYGGIATRSGAAVTSQLCETSLLDREHEKDIINEWLPEKNGNLKEGLVTDFLFCADEDLALEFYPVFSQTTTPNSLGMFYYDADGEYHETIVWENLDPWNLTRTDWSEPVLDSWVEDPTHWSGQGGYYAQYGVTYSKGVQINVPAGCKFGFFWKGNLNSGETTYYSVADKNEEVNCTDGEGNPIGGTSKIHAVTFQLEGKTYLGLEDWTDFDYQDWVFTCDRELRTVPAGDVTPDPTPGQDDPVVTPEDPEDSDEDVPTVGSGSHNDEVEINLAVDDKNNEYLESHLSIHVRTATDVEVFIPVPVQYYCEEDDMAIVMKHEPNHMGHGGPYSYTYKLKDNDLFVTLNVAFEDGGIRIWTEGITQEVIDWCQTKCHDGITFEVWNYFNEVLSLEELKEYCDQATVRFLDKLPGEYINAFGEVNEHELDCDVNIVDDQRGNYEYAGEGPHLNGSEHNKYYELQN